MRTLILCFLLFSLGISIVHAQVKIGENPQNIDPASLLELQSNSRALVITRVGDAQMQGLFPLRGALVYNTDQGCVFYYNGASWENLCSDENTTNIGLELQDSELILTDSAGNTVSVELGSAIDQTFSSDPVVGFRETIIITQTGDNYNFEVGEITGDNIVDSSINGIDLQDNSITADKLAPNSVGLEEMQDNAITDLEIDYTQVTLRDFTNDANFVAISAEPGNAIINNLGAFYDDTLLEDGVAANAQGLADHITDDEDIDDENELILDGEVSGNQLLLNQAGGNPQVSIDVTALNNSGSDNQNLTSATLGPTNILTINIEDGNSVDVNLSNVNTDEQDLANVLGQGSSAGGTRIEDLGQPTLNNDAATKIYVDNQIVSAGGTTELADGATIEGDGTAGNRFRVGTIGTANIADNAITSVKIANGTILGEDIAQQGAALNQILKWNGANWAPAIDETGAAGTTELADGTTILGDGTTGNEFRVGTIGTANIADNAVTSIKIANGTILGEDIAQQGAALNQILKWNGTIWAPAIDETGTGGTTFTPRNGLSLDAADNLDVNVDGSTIEINGGNILQVSDLGITDAKLANNSVTSAKISDGTILTADLNQNGANDGEILKWDDSANAGLGGWVLSEDRTDGTGIPALTDGTILIGNTSNLPVEVTMSGDATIDNAGVIDLADDAVELAEIAQNGATDGQVLKWDNTAGEWVTADDDDTGTPALTDGNIFVGGAGNVPTDVAMTGDATISNTGVIDLADDAVDLAEIAQNGATDGQVLKWDNTAGEWVTADDDDTGTPPLTDGNIFVGGAGNVPTDVAMTGDATISNTGVIDLADDAVELAEIAQNGATDGQVLKWDNTAGEWVTADDDDTTPALTDGNIFVGGAGNVPTDVAMTGDATISNTGVIDLADDAVELAEIAQNGATDGQVLKWDNTAGEWVTADDDDTGTPALTDGNIFVGGAGNVPTDVAMTGDATISNTGVIDLADDAVDLAEIAQNGATDGQVLKWDNTAGEWVTADDDDTGTPALTDGNIFVGGAGNVPTDVAMTGDATISNTGVIDLADDAVDLAEIAQNGATDGQVLKWDNTAGEWVTADDDDTGTPPLTDGNIFVGGAGNVPTDVAMTGDATISNTGVIDLADDAVDLAEIAQNGATDGQVLKWDNTAGEWVTADDDDTGTPALTDGNIFVGGAGNVPTDVAMTGDATISNTGVIDLADDAVDLAEIAQNGATDGQVLKWDNTAGEWVTADDGGSQNLFEANDALEANRTHDLGGFDFVFNGSGNVGIGTFGVGVNPASPTSKFHVLGQIRSSSFANGDGGVALPSYRFENDLNSGMWLAGTSALAFSTNSTEAIRIDASQNVGVGTTTPNSTLHTGGSFATAIIQNAGALTLDNTHHTVIITGNSTVTLPIASSFPGRIYIIKNPDTVAVAASPDFIVTISSYLNSFGETSTNVEGGVLQLQSDGTNWHQIN